MQAAAISLRADTSKREISMVEMCSLSSPPPFFPTNVYKAHIISQVSQSDGENKIPALMSFQSSQGGR